MHYSAVVVKRPRRADLPCRKFPVPDDDNKVIYQSKLIPSSREPEMSDAESLQRLHSELQNERKSYDEWASINPSAVNPSNPEFIRRRQRIKILRLDIEAKERSNSVHSRLMTGARAASRLVEMSNASALRSIEDFRKPVSRNRAGATTNISKMARGVLN